MSEVRYTEVSAEEEGQRLDNYLIRLLKGVPKSRIYKIIRGGEVRINKKRAKPESRIMAGDKVRIPPIRTSEEKELILSASFEKHLMDCIIYEDKELLVINKPTGLAVHGGSGLSLGVIEAFRKVRTDLPYLELVHRLDKETSGCLLLAKKRSMLRAIQALLESREVEKTYWALLTNSWEGKKTKSIKAALEKNILKSGERVVTVNEEAKPSETNFCLLENFKNCCLVEASPKTGRTHQIRVHAAFFGQPIMGDHKYGSAELEIPDLAKRLYLHARKIQFTLNGKNYSFTAELDFRFSQSLMHLRKELGTHA